jgi:hypothetical protein
MQTDHFWDLRERVLPLPTSSEGYVRVLFLGTTGAGKTTLVRQFLGTHPTTEHFPTTSGGKTTTADFEIVLAPGPFKAVITFLPRPQVAAYVEDCLFAAAYAYYEHKKIDAVARKFLEHEDQRFRLKYILGRFPLKESPLPEHVSDEISWQRVTQQEAQTFANDIQRYLERLDALVQTARYDMDLELDQAETPLTDEDSDIYAQERLEKELLQQDAFHILREDILQNIQERFGLLPPENILSGPDQWPQLWQVETEDRKAFIRTVNLFSSNNAAWFGKLLTPLVQGIRVSGPFAPTWQPEISPRLVLIDGEGLGHTAETINSLSTRVTQLFEQVDVIALVDNLKSPLQAASHAVLDNVTHSGHAAKLLIAFTHFEGTSGDDRPDRESREDFVRNALDQALVAVGKRIGQAERRFLEHSLEERVFFLSNLQERILSEGQTTEQTADQAESRAELRKMLATIQASWTQPPPGEVHPVYNDRGFFASFQKAVIDAFRSHWKARLGLTPKPGVPKEHWKRVEALARRVVWGRDEYDTLRPVADLLKLVSEQVYHFLEEPERWEPSQEGSPEVRQEIIDAIAREMYTSLHHLIRQRMLSEQQAAWADALAHSGRGSAWLRALDIDTIYRATAPLLSEIAQEIDLEKIYQSAIPDVPKLLPENQKDSFTVQIAEALKSAIQSQGGKLIRI